MKATEQDHIKVSYSNGKAKVTIPQGIRKKDVVLTLSIEQAEALSTALSSTGMWVGDGWTSYPYPPPVKKRKVKAAAK